MHALLPLIFSMYCVSFTSLLNCTNYFFLNQHPFIQGKKKGALKDLCKSIANVKRKTEKKVKLKTIILCINANIFF